MTDFRMTAPTLDVVSVASAGRGHRICEIGTPMVAAAEVVTALGSHPTVTFPMRRDVPADIESLWAFVGGTAEFFGLPAPPVEQVRQAVTEFAAAAFDRTPAALLATTITVVGARVVVTAVPSAPFSDLPVHIGCLDPQYFWARATDASWLQMATRTTSFAGRDHLLRGLRGHGCVDGIPKGAEVGAPLSGALVLETGAGLIGVESGEPTSILGDLHGCGVLADLPRRVSVTQAEVQRAWWISPLFCAQPVAMLGERALPSDSNPPLFLEQL
ncbi:hypothetical protein ABIA30_000716 [Mycobacterium sp. MAA66]|uniref:hypothetical protein n=1 Tax=Mycobacterium sp. MAA66 TaxID=3156297 RepID=UPI0035124DE3